MRAVMLLFFFAVMNPLMAKDVRGDYAAAEDAYRQGNFDEASKIYLAAIQDGHANASLFYNLGTSLYKNGEMGAALAAHLRARSLDPGDPDIRYNLQFLQEKARDKLDTRLVNDRWHTLSAAQWFTERALFWSTVLPLFFALVLIGALLLRARRSMAGWTLVTLLVLGSFYPGLSLGEVLWREPDWGAVVSPEADVMASPTIKNAVVIFQLHEAAPFAVIAEAGDWYKIRLSDSKTGWISREHVAIFGKNFFSYQTSKSDKAAGKAAL